MLPRWLSHNRNAHGALWIACALLVWVSSTLGRGQDLAYRDRGDRYEGTLAAPIAGDDIELIAVMVDYREKQGPRPPDSLKLRFYLPEPAEVSLTVRELDPIHYYKMDRLRPQRPWQPGFDNIFSWPTRDVLSKLNGLSSEGLGVKALIGHRALETGVDRAAPVILYHSQPPERINAYRFTVKTSERAYLKFSVFGPGSAAAGKGQKFDDVRPNTPVSFRWDATSAVPGEYRLVVKGYSRETSDPLSQTLSFYHQPVLK